MEGEVDTVTAGAVIKFNAISEGLPEEKDEDDYFSSV